MLRLIEWLHFCMLSTKKWYVSGVEWKTQSSVIVWYQCISFLHKEFSNQLGIWTWFIEQRFKYQQYVDKLLVNCKADSFRTLCLLIFRKIIYGFSVQFQSMAKRTYVVRSDNRYLSYRYFFEVNLSHLTINREDLSEDKIEYNLTRRMFHDPSHLRIVVTLLVQKIFGNKNNHNSWYTRYVLHGCKY